MNSLKAVIEYILDHEREDYLEQCKLNEETESEALAECTHVYAHAVRAKEALEAIFYSAQDIMIRATR